jgi:Ion channel
MGFERVAGSARGGVRDCQTRRAPPVVESFEKFGLADWRIIIGIGELVSAVLFLVPRTAVLGTLLPSAYLGRRHRHQHATRRVLGAPGGFSGSGLDLGRVANSGAVSANVRGPVEFHHETKSRNLTKAAMFRTLELVAGLVIWWVALWDSFATIVLPRTVAPMRRPSGRFNKLSWSLWAAMGRRIAQPQRQLLFLAIYGPVSVILVLILWAGLMIFAFTLIYQGLGARFVAPSGPVNFGTLLYTSASTFLTLGLGDVTSPDPIGRLFVIMEASSGFIFLGLMISYMPLLEQSYSAREVGNLLILSRAGRPPNGAKFLLRYAEPGHSDILRGTLREAERWMAEILHSHLSHPVLSFYRAQRSGQSWLVSVTIVLDGCALLIAGGEGLPAAQARITYRMGVRLLQDLSDALGLKVLPQGRARLTEADLDRVLAPFEGSGLRLNLPPAASAALVRLVRRYDGYLSVLSSWLVIPLPSWAPMKDENQDSLAGDDIIGWDT